jgi:hypothetical protein
MLSFAGGQQIEHLLSTHVAGEVLGRKELADGLVGEAKPTFTAAREQAGADPDGGARQQVRRGRLAFIGSIAFATVFSGVLT